MKFTGFDTAAHTMPTAVLLIRERVAQKQKRAAVAMSTGLECGSLMLLIEAVQASTGNAEM